MAQQGEGEVDVDAARPLDAVFGGLNEDEGVGGGAAAAVNEHAGGALGPSPGAQTRSGQLGAGEEAGEAGEVAGVLGIGQGGAGRRRRGAPATAGRRRAQLDLQQHAAVGKGAGLFVLGDLALFHAAAGEPTQAGDPAGEGHLAAAGEEAAGGAGPGRQRWPGGGVAESPQGGEGGGGAQHHGLFGPAQPVKAQAQAQHHAAEPTVAHQPVFKGPVHLVAEPGLAQGLHDLAQGGLIGGLHPDLAGPAHPQGDVQGEGLGRAQQHARGLRQGGEEVSRGHAGAPRSRRGRGSRRPHPG